MKKNQLVFMACLLFLVSLTAPLFVHADSSSIEIPNPIQTTSIMDLVNTITNYLLWIAVIGAPLALVVAALMFLTAGGNERNVKTAKSMLKWAVIGLAIALISKGIVSLIRDFLDSV